jgi:hypothetical protein
MMHIAKCIYYAEILLSLIEELTRFGQLAARAGGPNLSYFGWACLLGAPAGRNLEKETKGKNVVIKILNNDPAVHACTVVGSASSRIIT